MDHPLIYVIVKATRFSMVLFVMKKIDYHKSVNIGVLVSFAFLAFLFLLLYFLPVQNALIFLGERLVSHPLNHDAWIFRFDYWSRFFAPFFLSVFIFKFFSFFFSEHCSNSFLNLLRCIATMMVYILHTSIFTNSRGAYLFEKNYMKIFQTLAWGGGWIFFILSGYLEGRGFSDERYAFDMKSICRYYSNKFFKVIVPTFSFLFLCCVLIYPSYIKNNPIAVFKFLTFSYNGNPGANGIGATWYVFTLVPLYLLTPIFAFIVRKATERKVSLICIFVALIFIGFLYRYFGIKFGIDWYNMVYTPFFSNIDLFFGGICLNQIINSFENRKFHNILLKDFSLFPFTNVKLAF